MGEIIRLRDKANLKVLLDNPDFQDSLKAVASKYMTADRVMKVALLAAGRQPKLYDCTQISVLQSIIKAAELGLDFGGQTGQGYLIPYGNTCQFIPGYQGFIELAYRSKQVSYIDAQLVYANDDYDYGLGSEPFIKHKPCVIGDRGDILFGYCVIRLVVSEIPKIELMTVADILAIKDRSKAKNNGPWVTDEAEMMRKTVLRRAFKYIPKTRDLERAMEVDNEQFDFAGDGVAATVQAGVKGLAGRMAKAKHVESEQSEPDPAEMGEVPMNTDEPPEPGPDDDQAEARKAEAQKQKDALAADAKPKTKSTGGTKSTSNLFPSK